MATERGVGRPYITLGESTSATAIGPQAAQSIIGRDLTISGEKLTIIATGSLRVDGEIHGELRCTEVVIGETGKVTGSVVAERVEIHGSVAGVVAGRPVDRIATDRSCQRRHPLSFARPRGRRFIRRARPPIK